MTRAHTLISSIGLTVIFTGFLLLGGCTPARVGVFGNAMFSGGLPALSIAPAPASGLTPMVAGRLMASLETDASLPAFARVNYALFGDAAAGETGKPAPVRRHGHVLVTELSDNHSWEFDVESNPTRNEAYLRAIKLNGQEWTEHLLYADSADDWFSAFWRNNGRSVPEQWIGKRWSRDYANYYRVVMEYREPMPACIETGTNEGQSYFVHAVFRENGPECRRELADFDARAAQAFEVQNLRGMENPAEPGNALTQVFTVKPERLPNMKKLVGTAQRISRGGDLFDQAD
ncbi:MAG: DUF4851 domain-containing protein [Deltaproteobacteria bacterium]|nr:DUF4851 domain-containing protein [Deltaproteobacteria bacterium]